MPCQTNECINLIVAGGCPVILFSLFNLIDLENLTSLCYFRAREFRLGLYPPVVSIQDYIAHYMY